MDSYPDATIFLSGCGQMLSDSGHCVQGLTAPRKATISPASGPMAEWLRRGLQILARRFDSGSGLHSFDHMRINSEIRRPFTGLLRTDQSQVG